MTIPVSTVPTILPLLLAGIEAQLVADTSVTVVVGEPDADWQANNWIIIGEIKREVMPVGVVGGSGEGWLHEQYQVFVKVHLASNVYDATLYSSAWAYVAAIETFMRTDATFGGLLKESRPLDSTSPGPEWDKAHNSYIVDVTVPLWFYATL